MQNCQLNWLFYHILKVTMIPFQFHHQVQLECGNLCPEQEELMT